MGLKAAFALQNRLIELGYRLQADGRFGPITQAAVITFQGSRGLVQDGIVGPLTWAALGVSADQL